MAKLNLDTEILPDKLISQVQTFLIDSRTGNITLNIKDGRILGFRVEEIVSLKTSS